MTTQTAPEIEPNTVFVSNLNYQTETEAFKNAFTQFGEVKTARIITETFRGQTRSRGIGFIEFASEAQANQAISAKTVSLDGRKVFIRQARKKMVEEHITIGEKLRAKALVMVDNLDPYDVTPNELVNLLKVTQQFEETARDSLDAVEQATATDVDAIQASAYSEAGKTGEKSGNAKGISTDDAAEVVKILAAAGVLQVGNTKVGVRQTTTTEVVAENEL